jgi:hypothetical protein
MSDVWPLAQTALSFVVVAVAKQKSERAYLCWMPYAWRGRQIQRGWQFWIFVMLAGISGLLQ